MTVCKPEIHVPSTLRTLILSCSCLMYLPPTLIRASSALTLLCLSLVCSVNTKDIQLIVQTWLAATLQPRYAHINDQILRHQPFVPSYRGFSLCGALLWWKRTHGDAWKRNCSVRSGKNVRRTSSWPRPPLGCRRACGVKRSSLGGFSTNCKTNVDIAELPA